MKNESLKNYLILLFGVMGAASSVFMIKESVLPAATLSAVRLLGSAIILSPLAWRAVRERGQALGWTDWLVVLPAAFALAVHYSTWFVGVRETSAATSTLIVNLNPVLMPFLVWVLMRERINLGEVAGSVLAIAGVIVLTQTEGKGSEASSMHGILVCIGSISLCALYLAFGRRFGRGRSIFAYMVPLYFVAGLLSVLIAVGLGETVPRLDLRQVLIAIGVVVLPTVIGHTCLNYAMIHLPSQVVSISNLGQFLFVVIFAIPIRNEYPQSTLIIPALLVLIGALIVIRSATPNVRKQIEKASVEPAGT